MPNQAPERMSFDGLLRWATTPPQAYVVYLICVVLVGGVSFYVGTFKPKHIPGMAPTPAATAPQSK
ncbi:hypothetical protein [Rhodopseudomonas parapalustris]